MNRIYNKPYAIERVIVVFNNGDTLEINGHANSASMSTRCGSDSCSLEQLETILNLEKMRRTEAGETKP